MGELHISSKMKMSDLLASNYSLLRLLPRFQMQLGFGEKSVDDVCKKHGVPTDFFMLTCNVYTDEDFLPDMAAVSSTDMSGLIPYLLSSHRYYLRERLPHIEHHLHKIAEACDSRTGGVLRQFFEEYKKEVENHFSYEENTVFLYILSLLEGRKPEGDFQISQFEENHTNIEEKLNDFTNIMMKYLSGDLMIQERISVLFDTFELSKDLRQHSLIEDKILMPYVKLLESSGV